MMKITPNYSTYNINYRSKVYVKPASIPLSADRFEFSNKSNLLKAADLIPRKYINLLKERFFRDYTPEEILDMKNRYAEIINIWDTEIFLKRACKELKKDYNIENLPIKLDTNYRRCNYFNGLSPIAHCTPRYEDGYIEIGIDTKSQCKESLFRIMAHELRHVVQTLKCYQHSSNQEYANALLEQYKNLPEYSMIPKEDIMKTYITPYINSMAAFYEKLGIKKLEKTESSYNFGRKILKAERTYANKDIISYTDAYTERDAQETEKVMYEIAFSLNGKR